MWLEKAIPVLSVPQVVGSVPQAPTMGGWELGGIVSTKRGSKQGASQPCPHF